MTATFDAKVTVLERVTDELIRFRAAGKSVRGAIGNMRTSRTRSGCAARADGTSVLVEGDLVLAGALGSVGQKVVARQAGKVTAEFAANLQRALSGEVARGWSAQPARRPASGRARPGHGPARRRRRGSARGGGPAPRRRAGPGSLGQGRSRTERRVGSCSA